MFLENVKFPICLSIKNCVWQPWWVADWCLILGTHMRQLYETFMSIKLVLFCLFVLLSLWWYNLSMILDQCNFNIIAYTSHIFSIYAHRNLEYISIINLHILISTTKFICFTIHRIYWQNELQCVAMNAFCCFLLLSLIY